MNKARIILFTVLFSVLLGAQEQYSDKSGRLNGADKITGLESGLIRGKKVGIVTNHTARLQSGEHIVDVLHNSGICTVTAIFGPEHGWRGDAAAGDKIEHGVDTETGISVYSLYGKISKPDKKMLSNVDVLLFDIQDIGARFYTYISTLFKVMEAAAENRIPFIVLDRPNPLSGNLVEGTLLKKEYTSFVGIAPIPVVHGMTVGELAKFFQGQKLIKDADQLDLTVVTTDWNRNEYFPDYGQVWINPSPNIRNFDAALVYPGTCLFEATNLSEGRGTDAPFLKIGAPFIQADELAKELTAMQIPGLRFAAVNFTPVADQFSAPNPKHKNVKCGGVEIVVTDYKIVQPFRTGLLMLAAVWKLYPSKLDIKSAWLSKLTGTDVTEQLLKQGIEGTEIANRFMADSEEFTLIRKKYLLY